MKEREANLGSRVWLAIVVFGLFGQIAWVIENMYFNIFVYKTITEDPDAIALMVAASAVVATLTTLLIGALSDKLGKRKVFISIGYIVWGLVIALFAHISVANSALIFPHKDHLQLIAITVLIVVVMDCVMTFFGSTANDAAFNAWVTDVTSEKNRARVEGVLSALPLVAILVVFGGLDPLIRGERWDLFYYTVGGMVTLSGILGLFLLEDRCDKREGTSYLKDIIFGFRISAIRANRVLYLVFTAILIISTAFQVFMPYLLIYIENYLQVEDYALILGVVIILSAAASIVLGRLVDRYGKGRFIIPGMIIFSLGCLMMFILGKTMAAGDGVAIAALTVCGTIMMAGNLLLMLVLNALARDKMPGTQRGHFNGIRMIFSVMLPMIIGPLIGSNIIKASRTTFIDEFGLVQSVPIPEIFLAASLLSLLLIVPAIFILKALKPQQRAPLS
ncbi:MAG: MFS transporter [Firmicutes bacterium]|nr:MFS transporter [Bacillota bacterium]